MGTLLGQNFVDNTRYILDNRGDLLAAQILGWVNQTYTHVCQPTVHRHVELLDGALPTVPANIVSGTGTYGLNARINSVVQVRVQMGTQPTVYRWLQNRNPQVLARMFPSPPVTAPAYWCRGPGNVIQLVPTPDATWAGGQITVWAYVQPVPLTLGTATVIREMWDEVITVGAAYRGWRDLNRPDRSELMREEFSALANEVSLAQRIESDDETEIDVVYRSPMP